jgi:hypothetical protein
VSFTAKWPGDCVQCGEEMKGYEVEYNSANELQHVFCPEDLDMRGKPRPVCPHCFCSIPVSGVCDCRE